jgi:hypothetical protein
LLNKNKIKLPEYKIEDISRYIPGKITSKDIDINMPNINIKEPKLRGPNIKKGNIGGSVNINGPNLEGETIEGNIPGLGKSININGPNIDNKSFEININKSKDIIPNSLKGLFSGNIDDDIQLKKVDERLKLFPVESISGSIKGTPSINIEYGSTKGYEKPKIKKGKDFNHNPEVIIKGTIEGKRNIPPTLKSIFGGDVKENINLNNDLKLPQYKIEEDISGYIEGIPSGNINLPNLNIKEPNLKSGINLNIPNINEEIEGNIPGIDANIKGPKLKGKKIEGNIPGIDGNINIKGPNIKINKNEYAPNTLKGLFNGDINDVVHLIYKIINIYK